MRIVSHRGFWRASHEKNTSGAFLASFASGFGVETDVRDFLGDSVIAHDPPMGRGLSFAGFLEIAARFPKPETMPLAINIKADGLAFRIAELMHGVRNPWFVFDMSVPDMIQHAKAGNPIFARVSEIETLPQHAFLRNSIKGVWLDGFWSTWYDTDTVRSFRSLGLHVCVVSPELHGRSKVDAYQFWRMMLPFIDDDGVMICTDWPDDFLSFIHSCGMECEA